MELSVFQPPPSQIPKLQVQKLYSPTIQLIGHMGEVNSLQFSDSGTYLASCGYDKQIYLWDVFHPDCENIGVLKGHNNAVMDLCWSADAETLYTASADKCGSVWDNVKLKRVRKLKGHTAVVNGVDAVKRGPELVATCGDDFKVLIWDVRVKEAVMEHQANYQITCVKYSLTNQQIYFGGVDNSIKIWNLQSDQIEETILGHTDTITGIEVSHCGNYVLSNAMDQSLKLWDVRNFVIDGQREIRTFRGAQHNFENNLLRCGFSFDDSMISAGSSDRMVYVWDTDTGEMLHKLGGHEGSVNQTCFHPTQKDLIASGSSDKTVYLGYLKD